MGPLHHRVLFALLASFVLFVEPHEFTYEIKELGGGLELNCTNRRVQNTNVSHWVLNDLTVLEAQYTSEAFTLRHSGYQLYIYDVQENNMGDYFCVLKRMDAASGNETFLYFKSTVRRFEKSTWDEYRTQTIVGVTAAAITLVVMIGICLVWRFRWRPDPDTKHHIGADYDTADNAFYPQKPIKGVDGVAEVGFTNETFVNSNPSPTHGVIVDDTKF